MDQLISEHKGMRVNVGSAAGQFRNPYEIWQDENGKQYVKMHTQKEQDFLFDVEDLQKVLGANNEKGNRIIWEVVNKKGGNKYIQGNWNRHKHILLHHYLLFDMEKLGERRIIFENNDNLDMRRQNMSLVNLVAFAARARSLQQENETTNLKLLEENAGFKLTMGRTCNQWSNPYKVYENDKGEKIVHMYFGDKDNYFVFDWEDLEKVKNCRKLGSNLQATWKINAGGYIEASLGKNEEKKEQHIYLHTLILGRKQGYSIDHRDHDKLNNRRSNLKHATQSEQNRNRDKIARNHNAIELPNLSDPTLLQMQTKLTIVEEKDETEENTAKKNNLNNMSDARKPKLFKFMEYIYNEQKQTDYFLINEHHPAKNRYPQLKPRIESSKSKKVSIDDKYKEILVYYEMLARLMDSDTSEIEKKQILSEKKLIRSVEPIKYTEAPKEFKDEIDKLPFCTYYLSKDGKQESIIIRGHPGQKKLHKAQIQTSKSKSISLGQKIADVRKILEDLDKLCIN